VSAGTVGEAYRYDFALRTGSGAPRTGAAADVTVTIWNPARTTSTAPTVVEVGGGDYYVDIPAAFTTAHGVGEYSVHLDVTVAPRDQFAESIRFHARDIDDAAVPGDAMDLVTDALDAAAVATSGAQEIRDEILTDATAFAGANIDAAISSRESEASAGSRAATNQSEHDATQALIAALNDVSIADVQTALDNQGYTSARAILIDNLDAAVSTRAQPGDAMALTASQVTALVDAFWDEDVVAAHGAADSAGLLLRALGAAISQRANNATLDGVLGVADSPGEVVATAIDTVLSAAHGAGQWDATVSAAAIAAAVWDALRSAHVVAGSFGEALQQPVLTAETNILAAIAALNDLSSGDVDAAITANAAIVLLRKALTNRRETNPTTGTLDIYNDADTAVEFSVDIYEDVGATQPYRGLGIDRQDKIV